MKRKRQSTNKSRIVASILILNLLFTILGISSFATVGTDSSSNDFIGLTGSPTDSSLADVTKPEWDEDGALTTPISDIAPQITFLIPGWASSASHWSNNYDGGTNDRLAYNENSLVEKLRDYADANVYYANVITEYEDDEWDEDSGYGNEGGVKDSLKFLLYEWPDRCFIEDCESHMFEENLDVFVEDDANVVRQISDISKHIVILFNPADASGSNDQIYEQFDYVADKIVYDVKMHNGGELPKVNLITHSRGGLTAMEYALDHSLMVDSLITIGTPFEGTYLGQEAILNLLGKSADRSNEFFTYGVEDILNPDVYNDYKDSWNQGYDDFYSHINFIAIAGVETLTGLKELIQNEGEDISNDFKEVVKSELSVVNDTTTYANGMITMPSWDIVNLLGDLFIDPFSQQALEYEGAKRYVRRFTSDTTDLNMRAIASYGIPHNLEPCDPIIHSYILKNIEVGAGDSFIVNADGGYTLTKDDLTVVNGVLTIPSYYDGLAVTRIDDFAFYGNTEITSVTIPATVKSIGYSAFEGCTSLQSITFAEGSLLETIESYAFSDTGLTAFSLGANVNAFDARAFVNSPIASYTVDSASTLYQAIGGAIYSKDGERLIAYPAGNTATSFALPDGVESIYPYAFYSTESLTSVDLNEVTYVAECSFANCSSLSTITATELLLVGEHPFDNTAYMNSEGNVKSLGKVLLKHIGTESALSFYDYYSIAPAAVENSNLEKIILGGDIVNIGALSFFECENLAEVFVDSPLLITIEDVAFNTETANREIYVAESLIDDYLNYSVWGEYFYEFTTHQTEVNYNTNGGNELNEEKEITFCSVVGELATPVKSGFSFDGWTQTVNGEEVAVNAWDVWSSTADEVTFNANWNTETYSAILWIGPTTAWHTLTYTVNDTVTLPIPSKSGYTFGGWYDNSEYTGSAITEISVGTVGDSNYYAKWNANTYTVALNYDYDGAPASITSTVIYGENFNFAVASREGYAFNGWFFGDEQYTSSNGASVQAWDIANDVTLTADWTLESYYVKIVVNANGTQMYYWMTPNGLSENQSAIQYGQAFDSVDALNSSFNPSKISLKEGHKYEYLTADSIVDGVVPTPFSYWNCIAGDFGDNNSEIVVQLNAYFVKEINFSIVFEGYNSSASGSQINPIFGTYGDQISLWSPTKTGYTFNCWRVADIEANAGFENTPLAPGQQFNYTNMPDLSVGVEEDGAHIHLVPEFTPNNINIAFNSNGGSTVSNATIVYDATSFAFTVPTKNGYNFVGWFDADGNQYSNASGGLYVEKWDKAADTTLYAHWELVEYTITYVTNGGTHSNPSSYTVEDTIVLGNATKSGYRFIGWYTSSSYTTKVTQIGPGQTGNITLYAKLEQLYTIKFTNQSGATTTYTKIAGEKITVPGHSGSFNNNAYYYVSGSTKLASGALYTVTGNMTFTSREKTFAECATSTNYYQIYTPTQLKGISGVCTSTSVTVKMMNHITVTGSWTPITNWKGIFDGNGYTVSGISISIGSTASGSYGMFKQNNGTIKNLNVSNSTITASSGTSTSWLYVGALVGINYGTITYSGASDVTITVPRSTSQIGAVIGRNSGGNCSFLTTQSVGLSGSGDIGVTIGASAGGALKACFVYGQSVTITITGTNRSAGGIVGYASANTNISYCYIRGVNFVFGSYTGIDATELAPNLGYIVGNLTNSTMRYVGWTGCSVNYGSIPETAGTIFNRHYPRANICALYNSTCGYASGSTVSNTTWGGSASDIPK